MNPFSVPLNLPEADVKLRPSRRGIEIYDPLRRRWLLLQPEEWVRQQFTAFLISHLGVPASRMANEVTVRLNDTVKRCDTVVYDPQLRPLCIVEYKAPNVALSAHTVEQIARYNLVLGVGWLIISNGLRHACFRVTPEGLAPMSALPSYAQMTAEA